MKFSSFVGEPLELPQTVPSTRRVMQLLLLRQIEVLARYIIEVYYRVIRFKL